MATPSAPPSVAPAETAAASAAAKAQAMQTLLQYLSDRFDVLQLFLLAGYGTMCLLCVVLIMYLRYNRNVALRGDSEAARKIILPAFEPLLWILGATTGIYTLFFCIVLVTNYYTTEISKLATEVFYSGRQFVFVIVVVFLLQKSVSLPALRRTVLIAFVLSTYTLPIVWYMVTYGAAEDLYWVLTTSRALLLLLYTYVLIWPPGRATPRTMREYCVFAYIYYALLFTYNEMFHQGKTDTGFTLTYANLLCGALCPLVIWRVLKADTEYWRGMGQRACALQSLFRQKHNINEHISSQGLHVLIEMHRRHIIDFAYLELKQKIGVGASAVVFDGILHSTTPVAIKVYTPTDFTEETVAGFSHEAALCGALYHPNIVKFYGMCVFPPTICLVSELCQGSLADVTIAIAQREQNPERQQFLINVQYMIDAARAVAYIHSFSPAFLHRDIKPDNFLVDDESNVKLSDFGESRSIPRTQIEANSAAQRQKMKAKAKKESAMPNAVSKLQRIGSTGFLELSSVVVVPPSPPVSIATSSPKDLAGLPKMTVKGTVDYMAPEVINGRAGLAAYGEAADVYSLAITMWDILSPGKDKYPLASSNHFQVFEAVLDGQRPPLDPRLHASLREVIESAWQTDPRMRPSAQNIVQVLEQIQEEVTAVLALQLFDELSNETRARQQQLDQSAHSSSAEEATMNASLTTGEHIVEYLMTQGISNSCSNSSEALRMGNALMDAGLLHHVRHARAFENTVELYFFDEDAIQLCHPIAFLEPLEQGEESMMARPRAVSEKAVKKKRALNGEDDEAYTGGVTSWRANFSITSSSQSCTTSKFQPLTSRSDRSSSQSMRQFAENGVCSCRKLGQRLETAPRTKMPRRHRLHQRFRRKQHTREKSENLLTAKLLHHDNDGLEDELSEFETVAEAESTEEQA